MRGLRMPALAGFPYNHSGGFGTQTKNDSFCFKALILFMEMLKNLSSLPNYFYVLFS